MPSFVEVYSERFKLSCM